MATDPHPPPKPADVLLDKAVKGQNDLQEKTKQLGIVIQIIKKLSNDSMMNMIGEPASKQEIADCLIHCSNKVESLIK